MAHVFLQVKNLSDAIIEPITKAYRVGGFGLAFLLLGALMMLTATVMSKSAISYLLAFVGFVLVALPCYFFYVKEILPIARVQESVKQSREMIDTVQATALSMTELTLDLQALAFKHADQVTRALDLARPQIRALPVVGQLADHPALTNADRLSKAIVATTRSIKEIVADLQVALVRSDPGPLRKYLQEVEALKGRVIALLESGVLEPDR